MTLPLRPTEARSLGPVVLVTASLALLTAAVVAGVSVRLTAVLVIVATAAALVRPSAIGWPRLMAVLILIILFIPIRRYTLPASLPFQLEPYRLFVAVLVLGWVASLLIDPATRLRRTGFEGPLLLIIASSFASVVANAGRVAATSTEVNKSLMFLLSFVLVFYIIVSVVRRIDNIDYLTKTLVGGGGLVACAAIVEARTGFNVFNHLSKVMPFLQDTGNVGGYTRVGTAKMRVFASAQHPIALSAAMVMLIPLALHLARRYRQRRWLACAVVMAVASASTISRTAVLMVLVVGLVFLWLRPRQTIRCLPALVPALIAVHILLPGTLGALKQSFMPAGGLVAEQKASPNSVGSGRLADVGPGIDLWKQSPLFGEGYGTQTVDLSDPNSQTRIFDDQWLGTLTGTGIFGTAAWLWFFARAIRRFGAEAKEDQSDRGWLLASIAAGVGAYAVGMLTFDAFSFIQVTFMLFMLVALGSALLAEPPTPLRVRARFSRRFAGAAGI
jgi:O-antigen ligase